MGMNRRYFLTGTGAMGLGLAMGTSTQLMAASSKKLSSANHARKRLLILGGTGFIGPHMVREALRRRHDVATVTEGFFWGGRPIHLAEPIRHSGTGRPEGLKSQPFENAGRTDVPCVWHDKDVVLKM